MEIDAKLYSQLKGKDIHQALIDLPGTAYRDLNNRLTKRIVVGGQAYFLKYHHGVGWGEIAKNFLSVRIPITSAYNEWRALTILKQKGILVPAVFGYDKKGLNPATQKSFVVLEAMEPSISVEELALQNPPITQKWAIIDKIAEMTRIMHEAGVYHHDLYLCHFLLLLDSDSRPEQNPKLALIDFHRAKIYKNIPLKLRIKDLAGLYFSAKIGSLTKRDKLRFLKKYFNLTLGDIQKTAGRWLEDVEKRANKLYQKHYGLSSTSEFCKIQEQIHSTCNISCNDNTSIKITEILRVNPNKRIVAKGLYQDERVVVKIYFHKLKRALHARRDEVGSTALFEAGIKTPRLIKKIEASSISATLLIYEEIFPIVYTKGKENEQGMLELLPRYIDVLAEHHQAGIYQSDLHIGNFLLTDQDIYSIDGDQIVKKSAPLSQKESIENLAIFLAQFSLLTTERRERLVEHYFSLRQLKATSEIKKRIERLAYSHLMKRSQHYMEKVYRDCTQISVSKTYRQYRAIERKYDTATMQHALSDLDSLINKPGNTLLKDGNTCTVCKVYIGDEPYVLKRYNIKNIKHFLNRFWRPTRAWRSWYGAHLFQFFGIPSVTPVFLVERRFGRLRREGYFMAEVLVAEPLPEYFQNPHYTKAEKEAMANQAINLLKRLKHFKIGHGDMKEANFLVKGNKLYLIDLDSVVWYRWKWLASLAIARDWKRFIRNWKTDPEISSLFEGLSP